MNKQSFIESLNLYLDGELSDVEAEALLEAVRENPDYRRLYVQYCQIHNACSQLGERLSPQRAPAAWRQKVYAVGGMAAAVALLALAVRNLTPFIADPAAGTALATASVSSFESNSLAQGVNDDVEEVFTVSSPDALVEMGVDFEGRTQLARFGGDDALSFQVLRSQPASSRGLIFAGFRVNGPDGEVKTQQTNEVRFAFGKPVQSSTMEHELLISGEEEAGLFSVESLGSAFSGEGSEFKFDLSRAAAVKVAEPRK